MLTTTDLQNMTDDPRWLGWGYLGERERLNREVLDGVRDVDDLDLIGTADTMALAAANRNSYTYERLFFWANSRTGRHYADCQFGANGQHAERHLPR